MCSLRNFPLTIALLVGALSTACAPPERAENLVIVCLDTVRVDHLSTYGYSRPTTPTLDRLAQRAVLYRNASTPSNWTVPAVASLFTSRTPEEHGAYVVGDPRLLGEENPPGSIRDDVETLAERLQRSGFATGLFSANPFLYGRFQAGFDAAEVKRVDARVLTDLALDWWRGAGAKRKFLYIQYMDAHQPNRPPDRYFQEFSTASGRPREERHADWSYGHLTNAAEAEFTEFRDQRIAAYDGSILYIDDQIDRLLQGLEMEPASSPYMLMVTADHGEEFWDHAEIQERWRDDPRGIWGVGHGHTFFEELLHVPLLVAGPGFRTGGSVACPVSLLDLVPTALDSLSLPAPGGLRGAVVPKSDREICPARSFVATQPAYGPLGGALRRRQWKIVEREGQDPLLFDLAKDPGERENLAAAAPHLVEAMQRELRAVRNSAPSPTTASPPIPRDFEEQLRALGYL